MISIRRTLREAVLPLFATALSLAGMSVHAQEVRTYLVSDLQGSPVIATDAYANVTWSEDYLPYGERRYRSANSGDNERWFTGAAQNEDTGLIDLGNRYYDPVLGRFLSVDPVGASGEKPFSVNRYAYGNNNPYKFVDLNGRESVVANGRIYINPESHNVPKIILQNNVGATGVNASSWSFHTYDVTTPTTLTDAKAIGNGIANNPTPGNDGRASPMGTVNNVGHLPFMVLDGGTNMVRSYLVASPDSSKFTDITVNYTINGQHSAEEGFVMKYGEIGTSGITLRSYGEGDAIIQAPVLKGIWKPEVDKVWQQNHQEIIRDAK